MSIRPARIADLSRMAEIYIFNNRLNFFPIFREPGYSFGELQVIPLAEHWLKDPEFLSNTYVFDEDGLVFGFIQVIGDEARKLFVEPYFQSRGIGAALLTYAIEHHNVRWLWALEKNTRAIAFYSRHGFFPNGEKKYEDDTTEFLIKLERQ